MLSTQVCLNCKKSLTGRTDKKFCCGQCRSNFNNQNKRPYEETIKRTNAQLRKNRTILKTLCPTGKATVRKEVLAEMGYSFRHFSSMYGKYPKSYFLCYDYAYMPLIESSLSDGKPVQKVLIVQQQDFMRSFDPWPYLSGQS